MKKRIFSAFMALVLIVAMYSGIRLSSVSANADEKAADVTLSVTTDKTDLRPGDEVTVTVKIDSFNSTISGDTDPLISTYQVFVPVDTDVFEYVNDSKKFTEANSKSLLATGKMKFDAKESVFKSVAEYDVTDEDVAKRIYRNGSARTNILSFVLKVKDNITDNTSYTFNTSTLILKNIYNADEYSTSVTPAKVNVIAKELSSIEVSKNPTKTSYFIGSKNLDVTGGKLKLTYSNGTSEEVDMTADMCSAVDLSTAGTKTVTVTYQGKTTTFDVKVYDKKATALTLNGVDGKNIVEGTDLDLTGMTLDVTYDDSSKDTGIALTPAMIKYDNKTVGKFTVTVSYAGLTQTFTIDVVKKSVDKIEMKSNPTNTEVFVGKTMDVSGAKITATYNNGTTEDFDVTAAMCSTPDTSVVGKKTVTVTYNGKTTEFSINVVEPQPESVALKGVEGKSVKEGKELDLTGMKAVVKYNDGSSKEVVLTKDMLSYSTSKAGKTTVKVSVLGLNAEFTIDVVAKKPVSMKLSGTENKSVVEGMKLDLTGITAEVTYDNDTKEPVKVTEDMVSYKTDKVGSAEATVKIGDLTEKFSFTVVAKTLKEIKIVSAPTKVVYLEGQKFDSTGLSVQAVYDNGTTADVTKNVKLTAVDTAKAGKITVKVTYEDKVATFDVEVKTKAAIEAFNASVAKLLKNNITKADIDAVKKLRADYDAMSATEQAECNVKGLTKLEESVNKILEEENKANDNTQNSTENVTDNNGSSTGSSESGNGVKTGDAMNMYMYMILALLAGISAACAVPYARRNRK